jgi:hypothetical protein
MAELLDAGYKVLVYNGDRDLSCCVQGTEVLLDTMEWGGAEAWADTTESRRSLWMVDGEVAGYSKQHAGLEFVVVYNSGHLVPLNQPKHALDLVTRFIQGSSFSDVALPVFADAAGVQAGADNSRDTDALEEDQVPPKAPFLVVVGCSFIAGIGSAFAFTAFNAASQRRGPSTHQRSSTRVFSQMSEPALRSPLLGKTTQGETSESELVGSASNYQTL